jgi:predicted DCC family thiol-disulfide oxidoreductase YuxK
MSTKSDHPIVLFDGVCNLCESTVRFIIRRDRHAEFRFAVLQSNVAQKLMSDYRYTEGELNSVLLVADNVLYRKSSAGLQIAKRLDGAWPLLYYLFFWVPRFITDPIYDFIGNRRYDWFGKKEECWIPTDDLRRRFLDDLPET